MSMKTSMSLGQLALEVPGATQVLRKHHLDFCCGGKKSLEEACKSLNLNANEIISELEALEVLADDHSRWENKPLAEMVDHIVKFYHDRLRAMVPELVFLANKVEKVHAEHSVCPKGLAAKLQEIQDELFDHMMKEEQILFPLIKNGQGQHAYMPIKVMQEEHNWHGESLKALRTLAFEFNAPEGACGTWRALYKGLDQLELELMEHIHLENNILFIRALQA